MAGIFGQLPKKIMCAGALLWIDYHCHSAPTMRHGGLWRKGIERKIHDIRGELSPKIPA